MATDRKTVYKSFGYLRCDDFATYLEEMAAKGWHLESWGAGLHFVKGAPEQATYAVEVFSDATEYDTRPEPNTREFAEYCEAAGWHLVDAKRKFVIFKKLRPDALPIMTDQERLEAVTKEEKKQVLRNLAVSGPWVVLRWMDFLGFGFVRDIFIPENLLLLATWTMLFLAALSGGIHLLLWKHRTAKRIAEGQMLYLGKGGAFQNRGYNVVLTLVLPLWLCALLLIGQTRGILFVLAVYGILFLMGWLIAKKRPDAVTNQIIQVLVSIGVVLAFVLFAFGSVFTDEKPMVSPEDVPLLYEDMGGDAGALESIEAEKRSSIFGSMEYFGLFYEDGYVVYFIYNSDESWVLDKIWKEETDAPNWEDCTDQWDAVQAVGRFGYEYMVRFPNRIVVFDGIYGEALNQEQIDIVRSKLCN